MLNLQTFSYQSQNVRTVIKNGEPWFLAKDVCDILEINNPSQALTRLDDDEKNTIILNEGIGNPEKSIVSESGLYSLILGSRKTEAKQFKRWITHEVIPSIRKHGIYATPEAIETMLNDPDTMIITLQKLKEERERRLLAEKTLEEQKPKIVFADAILSAKTNILVNDLAKILKQNGVDTGEKRLFKWLRDNEYLISRKGSDYNSPTQKSMELGLFVIKETPIFHSDGTTTIQKTSKVTPKGQQYFLKKFLKAS